MAREKEQLFFFFAFVPEFHKLLYHFITATGVFQILFQTVLVWIIGGVLFFLTHFNHHC